MISKVVKCQKYKESSKDIYKKVDRHEQLLPSQYLIMLKSLHRFWTTQVECPKEGCLLIEIIVLFFYVFAFY